MDILLIIQETLGYVLLACGYLMIVLLALLSFGNAWERDWPKFAWSLLWTAFGIAMVAKPTIALSHQLGL